MKSLVQFINESKGKPMYEEWEIHSYVDYMLEAWFRNNKNYANILNATDICVKRNLVKNCEIAVTLLECLADAVKLHFVSARDKKNKFVETQTRENAFYKVFKVVEAIANIDFEECFKYDDEDEIKKSIKEGIQNLKERIDILVKTCNEKYDRWVEELTEENKKCIADSNSCCTPVCISCDCCNCDC